MFILVNAKTNVIIGTAIKPVSIEGCSKNGQKVFEIPDHEFSIDMIGSVLKLNEEK